MICLDIKTTYSILDSLVIVKNLVADAKDKGYKVLAITDKNVMFGVANFYSECKQNDIKPIIGVTLETLCGEIILYAKNYDGYKNLCKLVTIKSEADIDMETLKKYSSNLISVLPFHNKNSYKIFNFFANLYFGYSNSLEAKELERCKTKVFLNNVLYLKKEDGQYLPYLSLIKQGKKEEHLEENEKAHHLFNRNDYSYIDDVSIKNMSEINDSCNVIFPNVKMLLPEFINPKNIPNSKYLLELCKYGLNKRLSGHVTKVYVDRLKYELEVIESMGFVNYFLVVYDFVHMAKSKRIFVGPGRGSAAGSLVSYALNITDVDPIKYDLLFERFLNPERVSLPDIDIDFEDARREEVVEYIKEKYGVKNVSSIITFGTLKASQAIRDIGRILNTSPGIIDKLAGMINRNLSLNENMKNERISKFVNGSKEIKKLYDIASHLEGAYRHTSVHAAGIVIGNNNLDNYIPLYKYNSSYLSGYQMEYLEDLGLLKMDLLILENLTIIREILTVIKSKQEFSFSNIPLDDLKTIKIFKDVVLSGIMSFETPGMSNFLRQLQVNDFEDIVLAMALFRPGTMDIIDEFIKTRNTKKITYYHPVLEPILKSTYGYIVYQEQIMTIARVMASFSYGEADILRRAMSKKKKKELENSIEKFVSRSVLNGYSKEVSVDIFHLILKFANYGFNRAHAVSYSLISYKMAYLKTNFPSIFLSISLNHSLNSEVKTKKFLGDFSYFKIKLLGPNINQSTDKYISSDEGIRMPLTLIKNIGSTIVNEIIEERQEKEFSGLFDFVRRMHGKNINRDVIERLIKMGSFDIFKVRRRTLVENLEAAINYADLTVGMDYEEAYSHMPLMKKTVEYSNREVMDFEFEMLGFYLSSHPTSEYKKNCKNVIDLSGISSYINKTITVIGLVDAFKEITTKKNEKMAFVTICDSSGFLEITIFSDIYSKVPLCKEKNVIKCIGKITKRDEKLQMIVNELEILENNMKNDKKEV